MKYNTLRYFVKVAEMKHYTNAAKALYISQPSLSYAIASLEDELGCPLFERDGRNVRLTKFGKIFYDHVSVGLKKIDEGVDLLHQLSTAGLGSIHFAYLYILGSSLIPKITTKFKNIPEYKDLRFIFGQGHSKVIIDGVKNGTYDLAITSYVRDEPTISFTPILKQKLLLIVPLDHPLAKKESVSVEEILPYPLITYNIYTTEIRSLIDGIFSSSQAKPSIIFEFEEESSIAAMVASGAGIAIVPDVTILSNLSVKKLELQDVNLFRQLYLIRTKGRYLPASSEAFYHFILSLNLEELF